MAAPAAPAPASLMPSPLPQPDCPLALEPRWTSVPAVTAAELQTCILRPAVIR